MRFLMKIECDNAAFEDLTELPRLVRKVATRLDGGATEGPVLDSNGNSVGTYWFEEVE